MEERDFGNQWRNIDAPGDTDYFVRFMDVINSLAIFREYKRQAIEMMDIRPGHQVLEVGCGTGEEVRYMGELVGEAGWVTGVDVSQTMIDAARQRSLGSGLPVVFRVADAHHLDFAENTFDACGCFSVFEIVHDPAQALSELVRVTKPGGRVAVPGPDTGTMVVNSRDRDLTRRLLNHFADKVVNGWIGRQLPGMFRKQGLADIHIVPYTWLLHDFELVRELWLQSIADNGRDAGVVTAEEAQAWLDGLDEVSRTEGFLFANSSFIVSGRKP